MSKLSPLFSVCVCLALCAGCGDKTSDKATDAGHAQAGSDAHDAAIGGKHDAGGDDEDGGHAPIDGDKACKLICEDRENRKVAASDDCLPKCTAQWPSLSYECQAAALDYGECATTAECTVVAECCYSEVGRYADQCPLDFQG